MTSLPPVEDVHALSEKKRDTKAISLKNHVTH